MRLLAVGYGIKKGIRAGSIIFKYCFRDLILFLFHEPHLRRGMPGTFGLLSLLAQANAVQGTADCAVQVTHTDLQGHIHAHVMAASEANFYAVLLHD